jgi:hypothetical protein
MNIFETVSKNFYSYFFVCHNKRHRGLLNIIYSIFRRIKSMKYPTIFLIPSRMMFSDLFRTSNSQNKNSRLTIKIQRKKVPFRLCKTLRVLCYSYDQNALIKDKIKKNSTYNTVRQVFLPSIIFSPLLFNADNPGTKSHRSLRDTIFSSKITDLSPNPMSFV